MKGRPINRGEYLKRQLGVAYPPDFFCVTLTEANLPPAPGGSKFPSGSNDAFVAVSGSSFGVMGLNRPKRWIELTPAGCLLTLKGLPKLFTAGPQRDVLVRLEVSFYPGGAGSADHTVAIGISQDGDLLGQGIYSDAVSNMGATAGNFSGNTASLALSCMRKTRFRDGLVIQPVAAKETADVDLLLTTLVMSVWLL